jgi:hypothetical protein
MRLLKIGFVLLLLTPVALLLTPVALQTPHRVHHLAQCQREPPLGRMGASPS